MLKTGQEDTGNPLMIQKFGCNLWSHWKQVELLLKKEIFTSTDIIKKEYSKLLSNGLREIKEDCTLEDGELLFSLYGIRAKQVIDPISNTGHLSANYPLKTDQIVILCYQWDEKLYRHFAPGNMSKVPIIDPISRGSNTIKYGYLHSLRVYDIK